MSHQARRRAAPPRQAEQPYIRVNVDNIDDGRLVVYRGDVHDGARSQQHSIQNHQSQYNDAYGYADDEQQYDYEYEQEDVYDQYGAYGYTDYTDLVPRRSLDYKMAMLIGSIAIVGIMALFIVTQYLVPGGQSNPQSQQVNVPPPQSGQTAAGSILVPTTISPIFMPSVIYWEELILNWANVYGADPNALATIMQIESCGDPQAISVAGAQGLFQVMPFHFESGEQMLDPDTNAKRGGAYFAEGMRITGGDPYLTFAGYNGGHGTAARGWNNWSSETQRYYVWSKGIYDDVSTNQTYSATLQEWLQSGGSGLCNQAEARLGI